MLAVLAAALTAMPDAAGAGPTAYVPEGAVAVPAALARSVLLRSEIDASLSKLSVGGRFEVSLSSRPAPAPINRMHRWIVSVARPDGRPVDDAKIEISGEALGRNRELPTAPRMTRYLGDGKYLIEGVRFNMAGWWALNLRLESGTHTDRVTFNIELK
jgi:hypothetical protein